MSSAITTFVFNALWQTTLIAAAGLALERLCAGPRWRFAVAAGAFVLACLAPLSAWVGGRGGAGVGGAPQLVIPTRVAWGIAIAEIVLIVVAAIRLGRRWWKAREMVRSGDVTVPMVAGIVRPVIVLPRYLETDDRLREAALAHERAHIARRDPLIDFALELFALPVAFHPVVVMLRRRIHELREMCCDEIAAGVTGGRDYAQALVAIARLAAPSPALAMAAKTTSIERRLEALRSRPRQGVPLIAAAIILAIAVACGRGAVRPHVGADLSGTWVLDPKVSRTDGYISFIQTIRQDGTKLAVTQRRQNARGVRRTSWQVEADGVKRPFPGVAQSTSVAVWVDDKLVVDLRTPQHSERGMVWLDGPDAMVATGEYTNRGRRASYHAIFRRQR